MEYENGWARLEPERCALIREYWLYPFVTEEQQNTINARKPIHSEDVSPIYADDGGIGAIQWVNVLHDRAAVLCQDGGWKEGGQFHLWVSSGVGRLPREIPIKWGVQIDVGDHVGWRANRETAAAAVEQFLGLRRRDRARSRGVTPPAPPVGVGVWERVKPEHEKNTAPIARSIGVTSGEDRPGKFGFTFTIRGDNRGLFYSNTTQGRFYAVITEGRWDSGTRQATRGHQVEHPPFLIFEGHIGLGEALSVTDPPLSPPEVRGIFGLEHRDMLLGVGNSYDEVVDGIRTKMDNALDARELP